MSTATEPPIGPGVPGSGDLEAVDAVRRKRRPRSFVLLRQIDADTPIHRLWAGTKLVGAVALSLTVSLVPTWPTVAVIVVLLFASSWLARVPRSAVPRPPIWLWLILAVGGALTVVSGGSPEVAIGDAHIGLGGLESYVLFTVVSVILIWAGMLIGWTTSLGEVGPAIGRLLGPLRRLRIPADEWAIAIALCMRSLPLLVEEVRVLMAARRLRPIERDRRRPLRYLDEGAELLVAALSVSLRRAAEMGEAMTARGGTASITERARGPRRSDGIAIVVIAVVCAAGFFLP